MHPSIRASTASVSAACLLCAAGTLVAAPTPQLRTSPLPPSPSAFDRALEAVARRSPDPIAARGTLLWRLRNAPTCYPGNLTQAEFEALLEHTRLLPPTLERGGPPADRFVVDPECWTGEGAIGAAERATRANLTYSFPADGPTWGNSMLSATAPNALNAALVSQFASLDRGREYIRTSLAAWRRVTGVTYTEVADDNAPMEQSTTRTTARGDIRFGGIALGTSSLSPLAYNAFPASTGASPNARGGDMCINTSFFNNTSYFGSTTSDFRYLRNTLIHEHGHGLGLVHTVPCDNSKVMEPRIGGFIGFVPPDDIRGACRNYGDRFSGNTSPATARDFGDLTLPSLRSVIEKDLATNGEIAPLSTNLDWFRFTLSSPQNVTLAVAPTGGSYQAARQLSGCDADIVTINAAEAGNLELQLRSSEVDVVATVNAGAPGVAETIVRSPLPAGTYYVRVRDVGPNPDANQRVQLYDLSIQVGTAKAPPQAIAGVHKIVRAGQPAHFNGQNSRANQPTASLNVTSYAWDLDGDGEFETLNSPIPSITYVSNGVYPVTLRVTDSLNSPRAFDTIQVTVVGATTAVDAVAPSSADAGTTVPITVTGANFRGVTSSAQVTVSGQGVAVAGTPAVDALGTTIDGLSLVIAPGAPGGPRDITVTNSDGQGASGAGVALFTVTGAGPATGACCTGAACATSTQAACAAAAGVYRGDATACGAPQNPTTCCAANFDGAAGVDVIDIFAFLSAWFSQAPAANVNGDAAVDVLDIFAFLALWFAGC